MPRLLLLLALSFLTQAGSSRAQPQGLLIPHPEDAAKQVEYFMGMPPGKGPWPTLIFLHGHQEDPRTGGRVFFNGASWIRSPSVDISLWRSRNRATEDRLDRRISAGPIRRGRSWR